MELFYTGWRIVQQFIHSDAKVPAAVNLPTPADRQVAKELEMRREYPIIEVIAALEAQSQPDLLNQSQRDVETEAGGEAESLLNDLVISPVAEIGR